MEDAAAVGRGRLGTLSARRPGRDPARGHPSARWPGWRFRKVVPRIEPGKTGSTPGIPGYLAGAEALSARSLLHQTLFENLERLRCNGFKRLVHEHDHPAVRQGHFLAGGDGRV